MQFKRILRSEDTLFEKTFDLYLRAFPKNERRTKEGLIKKLENERFLCNAVTRDSEFCGLLNYWDFDSFIYGEHFAIEEHLRNQKLGGTLLEGILNKYSKPMIIEVEPPETEIAKRRIGLYNRYGFEVTDKNYIQPKYQPEGKNIPLYIMSTAALPANYIEDIYKNVYDYFGEPLYATED